MNHCFKNRKEFWCLFFVLSVTFLVFSGCLGNQFTNWDDGVLLTDNHEVQEPGWQNLAKIFTKNYVGTYIPLTVLSFKIEYLFFQGLTFVYYLNNLLLHLAVVACVFMLGQRFGLSVLAASCSALLFGIHPMHVESVAWVSQRKDLLCSFFYLLALLKYLDFVAEKKAKAYLWALFFGFCSILAKPMAYSLPFILFLCDWWRGRNIGWRVFAEKLSFVFVIGLVSLVTYSSNPPAVTVGFWQYVLVCVWVFIFHLQKFFFPHPLLAVYEVPQPLNFMNLEYVFAGFVFAGLAGAMFLLRKNRWFLLAVFFYFFSNFMIIARAGWEFGNNTVVADRFMYMPSLGFCFALGGLVCFLYERVKKHGHFFRFVYLSASVVFFLILCVRSVDQIGVWKNSITLWSHVLFYYPQETIALQNRAGGYVEQGAYLLAKRDLDQAIALTPNKGRLYYARADLFEKTDDFSNALTDLNRAQQLDPQDANIYFLRAKIYQSLGQFANALKDYNIAVEKGPEFDRAFYNRGIIFDQMGKPQLALADYARVILLNPRHQKVYNNRAVLYIGQKEYQKARMDLLKAVKLDPQNSSAYGNLGVVAFLENDYERAFVYFEKAILLDPQFSQAYVSRAIIYAMAKKNDLALADLNRAILLDAKNANAYFNRALLNYNFGDMSLVIEDLNKTLAIDSLNVKAQNLKNQIQQ